MTFFSQTAGNGFASGYVLSRTRPDAHTPKVGFEKSQKFVNFWIFPHPQYLTAFKYRLNSIQKLPLEKIRSPLPTYIYPQNTTQLHFVVFRVEELAHKLDNILSNY